MEKQKPPVNDDVVRIGGEVFHLRSFTEEELDNYMEHRANDIDVAVEDIAKAAAIRDELYPAELPVEAMGERPDVPNQG